MTVPKILKGLTALGLSATLLVAAVPAQAQADQNIVETALATESTTTLAEAVQAADLADDLSGEGPFTVFAPTNQAFAKLGDTLDVLLLEENQALLAEVLTYHVVAGDVPSSEAVELESATSVQGDLIELSTRDGNLFLNNSAQVITPDIEATNGRIHLINEVILSTELTNQVQQAVQEASQTIADIAIDSSQTSTLEDALIQADLVDTLSGNTTYTVFAPTNEAFDNLGADLDILLEEENEDLLLDILTYHVVTGDVSSDEALALDSVSTLQGDDIDLSMENDTLTLNGTAQIVTADIEAANGRVHLIDEVILSSDLSDRLAEVTGNEENGEEGFDFADPLFLGGVAIAVIVIIIVIVLVMKSGNKS